VQFRGHVDYQDLPALYGLARVLVLPSVAEPWGLVVNEAIACGLPVLVSQGCGAAADLVENGQNGFVFDPLDGEDFAAKIDLLAHEIDLASFQSRSLEISSRWGLSRFVNGLEQSATLALSSRTVPSATCHLITRGVLQAHALRQAGARALKLRA